MTAQPDRTDELIWPAFLLTVLLAMASFATVVIPVLSTLQTGLALAFAASHPWLATFMVSRALLAIYCVVLIGDERWEGAAVASCLFVLSVLVAAASRRPLHAVPTDFVWAAGTFITARVALQLRRLRIGGQRESPARAKVRAQ